MGSIESIQFVLTWPLKVQDQQQEKIKQDTENFHNFKVFMEAKIEEIMESDRRKEMELANFKKQMMEVENAQKLQIEDLKIQGNHLYILNVP